MFNPQNQPEAAGRERTPYDLWRAHAHSHISGTRNHDIPFKYILRNQHQAPALRRKQGPAQHRDRLSMTGDPGREQSAPDSKEENTVPFGALCLGADTRHYDEQMNGVVGVGVGDGSYPAGTGISEELKA